MDQPQSTSTPESLALRLRAMINSNWITQALYVAAQLGLPDLLASGPKTSEHLAQATGAHAPSLHRLLRALVTIDIVRERAEGDFALLPMGALLQCDAATSLRAWAILVGGVTIGRRWATSLTVLRPGRAPTRSSRVPTCFVTWNSTRSWRRSSTKRWWNPPGSSCQRWCRPMTLRVSGGSSMWEAGPGSCSWPSSQPTRRRPGCSSIGRTPLEVISIYDMLGLQR